MSNKYKVGDKVLTTAGSSCYGYKYSEGVIIAVDKTDQTYTVQVTYTAVDAEDLTKPRGIQHEN